MVTPPALVQDETLGMADRLLVKACRAGALPGCADVTDSQNRAQRRGLLLRRAASYEKCRRDGEKRTFGDNCDLRGGGGFHDKIPTGQFRNLESMNP